MSTIKNILIQYQPKLLKISPTPQLDVEVLLSFALKKTKEFLYANPKYKLNKSELNRFKSFTAKRLKSEPIAYIIGEKEFYGLKFIVNRNVLIPRPETELIVDETLRQIKKTIRHPAEQKIILIDIGTGSGCIPISIIKNLPKNINDKMKIYAIDNSQKALNIAKKNAQLHKADKKINFIKNDLLKLSLINRNLAPNSKIIITANLPYISNSQYKKLSPDIKEYEPKNALIAGNDGLKYYRKLFKQIQKITLNKITLIIEVDFKSMCPKAKAIKTIKQYFPNSKIEIKKDLAGSERIIVIEK